jgi:hypothetical protein
VSDAPTVIYRYRPAVLDELLAHGIRPTTTTAPSRARDLLNDLYCYELRGLRDRLRRREFAKVTYAARVVALRERYSLLSIPTDHWADVEPPT